MSEQPGTGVSVRGATGSTVTYRIGGQEYALITNPRCTVCMSPHRFEIENQIVAGRSYRKIVQTLPEEDMLHPDALYRHYRNEHMPAQHSMTRRIVEEQAQSVGKSIQEAEESLVDGMTLMKVVVQKTFERIASGEVDPKLREGLAAAKMLADLGEYDQGGADQQAYVEAFTVYQEEAMRLMGPELFAQFGEALETSPVLKALIARYEGRGQEDEEEEETPVLGNA